MSDREYPNLQALGDGCVSTDLKNAVLEEREELGAARPALEVGETRELIRTRDENKQLQVHIEELKAEIERLKRRCAERGFAFDHSRPPPRRMKR